MIDIENAKKNGSIIPGDNSILLHITNLMTGKKLSQNEQNQIYQKWVNVKHPNV